MIQRMKFVLFGLSNVGKSTFSHVCEFDSYPNEHEMTLGVIAHRFTLLIGGRELSLELWDCAGAENQQENVEMRYHRADAGLYMYSCSDSDSYSEETMNRYLSEFRRACPDKPVFTIGNKVDESDCLVDSDYKISVRMSRRSDLLDLLAELIVKLN